MYYYFDCFSILPIVPYDYLMKLGILFKLELFFLFFKSRMLFTKTYLVYLYSSVFFYQFYFYIKFSYVLIAFTILIIATLFQIQENFIITLLPTFGNLDWWIFRIFHFLDFEISLKFSHTFYFHIPLIKLNQFVLDNRILLKGSSY